MNLWFATTNDGKIKELTRLVEPSGVHVLSLKDFSAYVPPPENGKSFLENARIKAKSFHAVKPNDWVLAEDSGIEVEDLGGLPGIHSARYAGDKARDIENTLKVIKMLGLKGSLMRKARYFCCLVLYSPKNEEVIFEGELKGTISKSLVGTEGFGYDPIFIPEGQSKTLGELGLAFKNQVSHRARAVEKLLEYLKNHAL